MTAAQSDNSRTAAFNTAIQAFRDKGGTLRTRDLITSGVHTDALYALRDSGRIIELGRGLYRLADMGEAGHPDLAVVAASAPNAVCARALAGQTVQGIASELGVRPPTVATLRRRAYAKLDISSLSELFARCMEQLARGR